MSILRDIRWRANFIIGPVFGFLLFSYFIYHSLQGHYGLLAWRHLELRTTEAKTKLYELRHQHVGLELRVNMLRPGSLDPDMLEEQGRRLLNFSHKDDLVITFPRSKEKTY